MEIGLVIIMSALASAFWSVVSSFVRLSRRPAQVPGSAGMVFREACIVSLMWIAPRLLSTGVATQEYVLLRALCGMSWFIAARSYHVVMADIVCEELEQRG